MCGVDPSAELLAKARDRVANVGFPVRLLEASSEKLPLENRSFDTIVMTFTLCSIPDVDAALARDPPSSQTGGRVAVCGAWACARFRRDALAGPDHAYLETDRRRLPS